MREPLENCCPAAHFLQRFAVRGLMVADAARMAPAGKWKCLAREKVIRA